VILGWRLEPDMFARVASSGGVRPGQNASSRLAGVEPPKFEDTETTIDQLKERIAKTVAYVKTLDAKAIDASSDREITFRWEPVKKGQMKVPTTSTTSRCRTSYFHLTAAYACARACGVEIGKQDYIGAIPSRWSSAQASANANRPAGHPARRLVSQAANQVLVR